MGRSNAGYGFVNDVKKIVKLTPKKQTDFFST
jgi:hypothetical protein